jgi:hypothetical protein
MGAAASTQPENDTTRTDRKTTRNRTNGDHATMPRGVRTSADLQDRVKASLLAGLTMAEAARAHALPRNTVHHIVHRDPALRAAVDACRSAPRDLASHIAKNLPNLFQPLLAQARLAANPILLHSLSARQFIALHKSMAARALRILRLVGILTKDTTQTAKPAEPVPTTLPHPAADNALSPPASTTPPIPRPRRRPSPAYSRYFSARRIKRPTPKPQNARSLCVIGAAGPRFRNRGGERPCFPP